LLVIRDAQMEAFSKLSESEFQSRAFKHLQQVLPELCSAMGEPAVRQSIAQAYRKARAYGLTYELDILRYLNLMYVLGFGFDTDSRYPWASEILSDSALRSGTKARKLMTAARTALAERKASGG